MSEAVQMIKRVEASIKELEEARDLDALLSAIAESAAEAFRVDVCGLFLFNDAAVMELAAEVRYPSMAEPDTARPGEGIIGWVAQNRETFFAPDVRAEAKYIRRIEATRSELAAPLMVAGELLGVLDLQSTRTGGFEPHAVPLLTLFARQAAATIIAMKSRAREDANIERLLRRTERLELIHRVGMTLIEADSLEDAMTEVTRLVATTLNYSQTAVLILDDDLEELNLISAYGYGDVSGLRIPLSQGATGYAVRHGEPVNIADVTTDPRYVKGISRGRSELAVPIIHRDRVLGVLDVESYELGAFGADDVRLLEVVATYAAAAINMSQGAGPSAGNEKE